MCRPADRRSTAGPDRMREIVRVLAEPGFGESAEELPGWRGRGDAVEWRFVGLRDRVARAGAPVPQPSITNRGPVERLVTMTDAEFAEEQPRFSVINFANADVVGHTGVIPAAVTVVALARPVLPTASWMTRTDGLEPITLARPMPMSSPIESPMSRIVRGCLALGWGKAAGAVVVVVTLPTGRVFPR